MGVGSGSLGSLVPVQWYEDDALMGRHLGGKLARGAAALALGVGGEAGFAERGRSKRD